MEYIGIEIGRDWAWSASCADEGWVSANDGSSQCTIGTDWEEGDQEHLVEIGKTLKNFPKKIPSQYSHEIKRKGDLPYFVLHAHAYTHGHLFLEIVTNDSAEANCHISFEVEPLAIHRLGELLLAFQKWERHSLKYHIMRWSPELDKDELVEFELSQREHPKVEAPQMDPAMKEWERLKRKHPYPGEPKKESRFLKWLKESLSNWGPDDWRT